MASSSSSRGPHRPGGASQIWINSPNHRRQRHPELIFTEQQARAELWSPTRSISASSINGHLPSRATSLFHNLQIPEHPLTPPERVANFYTPDAKPSSWKSGVESNVPSAAKSSKFVTPERSTPSSNPFADPLPMDAIMANIRRSQEYPQRMSQSPGPQSRERLARELKARGIAREQGRKLQKARTEYHQLRTRSCRTQTEPSVLAVAAGSNSTHRKSLRCWPFWVSVLLAQAAIASTAASIPVVINNRKKDRGNAVGSGVVLWLITSVITAVAAILLCVVIVLRRGKPGALGWVSNLGLDEIDNNTAGGSAVPDIEREVGANARELDERPTPERRRAAHSQLLDETRMPTVMPQLRNPMWYALYSHPEGVREYLSRVETPTRNSELLNRANSDIGVQALQPKDSTNEVAVKQYHEQVFSPQLTKISQAKLRDDVVKVRDDHESIMASTSGSMMPSRRPAGAARYFGNFREEIPLAHKSKRGFGKDEVVSRSEKDDKLGSASRRSVVGSELESYSPLEDLARDLSRQEVVDMPPTERAEYLINRKRQSEDRSLRTRASLTQERSASCGVGRGRTISMHGMVGVENEDGIELATLSEQEGYLADVDSEQTDGKERRIGFFALNAQPEGKVKRLRRMWEEGESHNGSMGSRTVS